MYKNVFLFICIIFLSSFDGDRLDPCLKFKYGKFELISSERLLRQKGYNPFSDKPLNMEEFSSFILRNSSDIQYEYAIYGKDTIKSISKVLWYSNCHYALISNNHYATGEKETVKIGDTVDVQMLNIVSENSVKIKYVYKNYISYDTLIKVSD